MIFGKKTWTDEEDAKLTRLWEDGHSTVEIGRRMLKTKNSIVGRAHRMGLPSRPSPVIRDGRVPKEKLKGPKFDVRMKAARLPVLPSIAPAIDPTVAEIRAAERAEAAEQRRAVAEITRIIAAVTEDERPKPGTVFKPRNPTPCCWPTGEGKGIRFVCDAAALPGKPYCPAHHRIAYTTAPSERADLAPWLPNRQGATGAAGVGFV